MSGLPKLPPGLPAGLAKYLEKLGQQFEVTQSDRGSPLKSKPTIQDLIDIGLIKANATQALKVNGKSFSLDNAANWLAPAVPTSFNDIENPPAPTGLVVTMNQANMVLYWNPWNSIYYGQTLIYRATANDLSQAACVGSTSGSTYPDNLPAAGQAYYYWIRTQAKSGTLSDYNATPGTTVGNVANAPAITAAFNGPDLVLSWPTPTSALLLKYYIVRWGASFEGGIDVGTSNTNTLQITADFGGTRTFWIAALDINDQLGTAGSIDATVTPPNAPLVTQTIQNDALVLTYSAAQGSLPVASYEIRQGVSWGGGASVSLGSGTRTETAVNWTGSRTFWVAAYDSAGNLGLVTQAIFTPAVPSAVTITQQVIDNNVLLSWGASSSTLSIASYLVDRGGVAIGTIAGLFAVIFEALAGAYTYGITAIDSAGNTGLRATVAATVSQPPDYQLQSNVDTDFAGGAATNCAIDAATGGLICNIDTSETWATHFSSRGWGSIDDQVAAGYPLYVVGKTTGSYQEVLNYLGLITSKITMTPTHLFDASGGVAVTPTIEVGTTGTTWPSIYAGVYSAFASSFQYVRYTLAFAAAHSGSGLATDTPILTILQPLNYRLDTKKKTFQGTVPALSGDSGGTAVDITGQFIDVDAITLTPLGTTAIFAVYDFADAPNPTSFKVLCFNTAGTRVSATVSYTLRGV